MRVAVILSGVDLLVLVIVPLLVARRVGVVVHVLVRVRVAVPRPVRVDVLMRVGVLVRVLVHRLLLVPIQCITRVSVPGRALVFSACPREGCRGKRKLTDGAGRTARSWSLSKTDLTGGRDPSSTRSSRPPLPPRRA